jgi:protein DJ-1
MNRVLTKSGIAKCPVTSHPAVKNDIVAEGWDYRDDRVVTSGNVITSRGPGTAILFALTLVEAAVGKEKRDEVQGPMITAEAL